MCYVIVFTVLVLVSGRQNREVNGPGCWATQGYSQNTNLVTHSFGQDSLIHLSVPAAVLMARVPYWTMAKDHRPLLGPAATRFIKDVLDRLERRSGVTQLSYLADVTCAGLIATFGYSKKDRSFSNVWPQLALSYFACLSLCYFKHYVSPYQFWRYELFLQPCRGSGAGHKQSDGKLEFFSTRG